MVDYCNHKPKSAYYEERDARWAAEADAGKTYKQIAEENNMNIQQVYRCVKRIRMLKAHASEVEK